MAIHHANKLNQIRFNPTLVRLRPCYRDANSYSDAYSFQSHAGSIEATKMSVFIHEIDILFQSHAGSIEAMAVGAAMVLVGFLFQSHAGSIEAPNGPSSGRPASPSFNPTLVRLRPPIRLEAYIPDGSGFNPTLVRLRPRDAAARVRRRR